jgi:hypothetical protein
MATITTNTFLDGGTARTAGEAFAIGNGARFTIRTDSRIHANAPASFTGSLGSPTFTDIGGEIYIDSSAVREIAYTGGTGNAPAIGTSITQGGVAGYYLGCWASIGSAPTAVGAAIPASGIIKLREVTGGSFAAGALGGISATCSGADIPSWIEIAWDAAVNFIVGRVGKFTTRDGGNKYQIGVTNGAVGQSLLIPTTSSVQTNNFCPGAWVETASGSGEYEFWQGLSSAANGWVRSALGFAEGYTDARGKFCKTFAGGTVQFGEASSMAGTYALVAGQASTYVGIAHTTGCVYTLTSNVVTVTTGTIAHLFEAGQSVYHDFTTGTAPDGTYTIVEVLDAYNYTINVTAANTTGNVTVRPGVTVTFTAHGLNEGESIYADFTSGTGVDGVYPIYAVTGANTYLIAYPHAAALTSGAVTVNSKIQITATAHTMAIGNEVYCDFTSGGATDGRYIMRAVAANTIDINYPFVTGMAVGNVTLKWTIGHVPPTGCKVLISNILWAEVATASRATNSVPNATIASRPEFTTTTAGAIDLEGLYVLSGRSLFDQAYSVRIRRCAFSESFQVTECATALDVEDVGVGMYSAQDARALQLTSNFAGGTVSNIVAGRALLGTTDHSGEILYCAGQTLNNITSGIINYARSTGIAMNIGTCQNLTFNGLNVFNGNVPIATSVGITINDLDYVDRLIGHTNLTTPYYCVTVAAGCDRITVDGITTGLNGAVDDCHPSSGLVSYTAATNIKIRNVGSAANYCKTGVWCPGLYATATAFVTGGNNNTVKIQKAFVGKLKTGLFTTINSDKNMLREQVLSVNPWIHSTKTARGELCAWLNADTKGLRTGIFMATAQTSVYGTHWIEQFQGGRYGAVILVMNEPTAETAAYWSNPAGVAKFNSAGGIEMRAIGAEAIWEMPYFAQGHTGFANITPVMTGGTIGNYTLTYQIDKGAGWNGTWLTLNTTNLTAETISPTTGFKLKIRIVTAIANATAITFLRVATATTKAAQEAIAYPLDVNNFTLTGLQSGSDVVILAAGTETVLATVEDWAGTSWTYQYETPQAVDVSVYKAGYFPYTTIRNYMLPSADSSVPLTQVADPSLVA